MRTFLCALACILSATFAQATDLFAQLRAFNPYWADHQEALEGVEAQPIQNEVDYVQAHLTQVLKVLSVAPIGQLSQDQLASRFELITVLQEYAEAGRFPLNYYRQERIPVFIDEHDTHCAVGHLMRHTGNEAMAQRIAAANNYAWVKEINDPDLAAWQHASGFSLAELKLIQGAYDFYFENAFLLPDKYEVPQKPERVVRYFEGADKDKVWCQGEGTGGDLHGAWVQNYSATLPWIVGYFEHGKRSGRWKEYYKGTDKLCRTEHWRNDKLNGIRTRYDREGKVIETIEFRDGEAVTKINIDHDKALRWVRRPVDSATVHTQVFTVEGALIAEGNERIHNPEGLSWFQNIELTALNTFAITARDGAPRPEEGVHLPQFRRGGPQFDLRAQQQQIPGSHSLVQYRKEGDWVYYKDHLHLPISKNATLSAEGRFTFGYKHFGSELYASIAAYEHLGLKASYDSMHVAYTDDRMTDLFGFASKEQDHLHLTYHVPVLQNVPIFSRSSEFKVLYPVRSIAELDPQGALIGVRVHYGRDGEQLRTEHFLVAYKEEELVLEAKGQ